MREKQTVEVYRHEHDCGPIYRINRLSGNVMFCQDIYNTDHGNPSHHKKYRITIERIDQEVVGE